MKFHGFMFFSMFFPYGSHVFVGHFEVSWGVWLTALDVRRAVWPTAGSLEGVRWMERSAKTWGERGVYHRKSWFNDVKWENMGNSMIKHIYLFIHG